jgi:hypothetical protein
VDTFSSILGDLPRFLHKREPNAAAVQTANHFVCLNIEFLGLLALALPMKISPVHSARRRRKSHEKIADCSADSRHNDCFEWLYRYEKVYAK